jgi:hypothetical protein
LGAVPAGLDSATFWDKGTTGHVQNLAKGRDGPGQPVKNLGRDDILTVYPVPSHKTKGDRAEEDVLNQKKEVLKQKRMSKTGKNVLKQENGVQNRKPVNFF